MQAKDMLYKIIEKLDITQLELACELEISTAQVSRLLAGQNQPHRKTYAKIKKLYESLW